MLLRKNMELKEKLDAAHRVMGRDTIADPAYGTPARRRRGVRQGAYRSMQAAERGGSPRDGVRVARPALSQPVSVRTSDKSVN